MTFKLTLAKLAVGLINTVKDPYVQKAEARDRALQAQKRAARVDLCVNGAEWAFRHGRYEEVRELYAEAAMLDPSLATKLKGLEARIADDAAARTQAAEEQEAREEARSKAQWDYYEEVRRRATGAPEDVDEDAPCVLDTFSKSDAARLKRFIRQTTTTPTDANDCVRFFAELSALYEAEGRAYPFSYHDEQIIRFRYAHTKFRGFAGAFWGSSPSYPATRGRPRSEYLGGGFETNRRRH